MPKQSVLPLPRLDQAMKKKAAKREVFLAEMDAAVPRSLPLSIIEPHYPTLGPHRGRPPISPGRCSASIFCRTGMIRAIRGWRTLSSISSRCGLSPGSS